MVQAVSMVFHTSIQTIPAVRQLYVCNCTAVKSTLRQSMKPAKMWRSTRPRFFHVWIALIIVIRDINSERHKYCSYSKQILYAFDKLKASARIYYSILQQIYYSPTTLNQSSMICNWYTANQREYKHCMMYVLK